MASIEDILARAKPRVEVVSICLAGDLRAEHASLSAELEQVQREQGGKRMAASGEAQKLGARIRDLEAEMAKSMQEFRFAGISGFALDALKERFPAREGKRETWNSSAAEPALVAACAVDPAMSEEQADQLRKGIAQGDWDLLVEAAFTATTDRSSVPFSVRASVVTGGSGSK